ncbi:MAG: hypothetical protein KF688_15045 [Pirellulales bacterium]|nr:hypothetical protein [Pirellulales bacterium]
MHVRHVFALLLAASLAVRAGAQQAGGPQTDAWGQPISPLPSVWPIASAAVAPVFLDELPLPPDESVRVAGLVTRTVPQGEDVAAAVPPPTPSGLPPGTRNGVFQKIYFNAAWLPALSSEPDALGFGDLETGLVLGFPLLRPDTPLLVTPNFGVHLLENAAALDLPEQVYEASVDFTHLRKFGDGPWAMNAGVTVGYYSDFEQSDGKATRVTGRAFAVYESSPAAKWVLGVVYLNRAGASVLPAAGVIYAPHDDFRLDLIFPRPKIAWRLAGSVLEDERWVYLGGELGGGAWSITRPSTGTLDFLNYRDLRVLAGYERKLIGGLSRQFEFGYVFARELEFNAPAPDVALDDTLFARVGLKY